MVSVIEKHNIISLLADEIIKDRLIVFIGKGLSISAGIPSWQRITEELLKKYHIETRDADLMRLASRLEQKAGLLEFRDQFAQRMVTKADVGSSFYETLAELNVNSFITTNYDHLLEESFRKRGYFPNVIVDDRDLQVIDPSRKTIVKLHGDIDFPRSLIITRRDYTRFKRTHRGLVDWLNMVVSQNTVLFLGTGFDNPGMEQPDEHILGLFDGFGREPVIFLKKPSEEGKLKHHFEIEMDDFAAICEDFKERGFLILPVDSYDEMETFLRELHKKVLGRKIRTKPSDLELTLVSQGDYIETLEQTLGKLLDEKTVELCNRVRGNGRLPSLPVMIERCRDLIHYLENAPHTLSSESQLQGWLTVVDALLSSETKDDIFQAREYFDRASLILNGLCEPRSWKEKFNRVAAKLLFIEGEPEQALELLSTADDNKSRRLWLCLLIDSGCLGEAYKYVSTHTVSPAWVDLALVSMVHTGHVQEADELFLKTLTEFAATKEKERLGDSPYENEFFYERVCAVFAHSLYRRVLQLAGKLEFGFVSPSDVTDEGGNLCRKALQATDWLFKVFPREDVTRSYFAAMAVLVEMTASFLLREWARADKAATVLISVRPVPQETVRYIVGGIRRKPLASDFLEVLKNLKLRLFEDHPNKAWAYVMIADLEAFAFENDKESWSALQQAADLADSPEDKQEVGKAAFEIGQFFDHIDTARALINDILPNDDLWRKYMMACLCFVEKDFEKGEHLLVEIESLNPPVEIQARTKWAHAKRAIIEKRWKEAKILLEESKALFRDPSLLKDLLIVTTELQDSAGALRVVEEMESFGIADAQVTHIKAQAASIQGLFTKSEEAWRLLVKQNDQRADYAYGLAEVLVQMDKLDDALQAVEAFVQCDEKTNLACLMLACQAYEMKEDYPRAFDLLQRCRDRFQDEPSLLMKHMDLAHRTDHDDAAHDSLIRLEILRREGRISEEAFTRVSLDQAVEVFKERRKSFETLSNLYKSGQIPRLMLSQWKNMPLYLDWAIRTQELSLSSIDPARWTEYTTYSTNSMRVQLTRRHGSELVLIDAPRKVSEIVIDYHALITIHRLGLLEKLGKRYSRVYYPRLLNLIWATDQKRFTHHQRSEERAYRELNEKLLTGRIRELVAPEPGDKDDPEENTTLKCNLRLARLENLSFVNAYAEEKEFAEFPEVKVFRLSQLVEWLYGRGRLGEKQFREIRDLTRGRPEIIKELDAELNTATELLIDEITLKVMEKHGLTQVLLDVGIRIVVERETARTIQKAVMELDFGREVGMWHQELSRSVKELDFFRQVQPRITPSKKSHFQSLYDEAMISSLSYAEEKGLFLLTDDRWTQMVRTKKLRNRQFGSDALLTDLYERDIISLEEYAHCFLRLCKWRYCFLIPDVRILVFFANQYQNSPLGRPLATIADYGHKCMEDPGLFMGPEPTNPPTPLGIKVQMLWNHRWAEFLLDIWQDVDISQESREQIIRKVFLQGILGAPKAVVDGQFRENLARLTEKSIIFDFFIGALGSKDQMRLHGLISEAFDLLGYDQETRVFELRGCLELLAGKGEKNTKEFLKPLAARLLRVFYGEAWDRGIDPSLIPALERCGFRFSNKQGVIPSEQLEGTEAPSHKNIVELFSWTVPLREAMAKYIPEGPAFVVSKPQDLTKELIIPHSYILSPTREERLGVVRDILKESYVTAHTKEMIRGKSDSVGAIQETVWRIAASEVRYALLKDFRYTRFLFGQFIQPSSAQMPQRMVKELVNEAWTHVTTPNLATVVDDLPILLQNPLEIANVFSRIASGLEEHLSSSAKRVPLHDFLDWYLSNVYFVPVAGPLKPWSLLAHVFKLSEDRQVPDPDAIISKGYTTSAEILAQVQEWLKDKEDPLALLLALDLILCARGLATTEEAKSVFVTEDFYEFLDEMFEKLLLAERRAPDHAAEEGTSERIKSIRAVWKMRVLLARYYLKYIDLNDKGDVVEDIRPALAWWMARELSTAILHSIKHFGIQDRIAWLEKEVHPPLERQNESVALSHLLSVRKKHVSPSRYRTLDKNGIPLSVATLSMLMPCQPQDVDQISAYNGLIYPTRAIALDIRDLILERLSLQAPMGEGQLQDDEGILPLLWDTPLCISVPPLLESYYGDDINFLGEEKINLVKLAKYVSQPDLLNKELTRIPGYIREKQGINLIMTLSALRLYLMTHAEIPGEAEVLKDSKILAGSIIKLDSDLQTVCLITLVSILERLREADHPEWVEVIGNIFRQIDYSGCSGRSIETIVLGSIEVVLMGFDYSLLRPIIERKGTDKRVRTELQRIKPMLENIFPGIPVAQRENLRRILNDIEDIPITARDRNA